jgi:hypothetical protein
MTHRLAALALSFTVACAESANVPKSQRTVAIESPAGGSEASPPAESAPDGTTSTGTAATTKSSDPVGLPATPATSPNGSGTNPQSGLLTAGTWDDNQNFTFFRDYLSLRQLSGVLAIDREDALLVEVKDSAGNPLPGATVRLLAGQDKKFEAQVAAEGRIALFPTWDGAAAGASLTIEASFGDKTASHAVTALDYMKAEKKVTITLDGTTGAPITTLDLAFFIDTTGSMGDELAYLQAEVADIATGVAAAYPNVSIRFALVTYKDYADIYVTRTFDFGSLADMKAKLAAESAGGGGDTPEAVEKGLQALTALSWQSASRVAFWTADAPYHPGTESTVITSLHKTRELSIHMYPIAASGTDDLAEAMLRDAAEVTAGRYLFLTDDSGIGNAHQEPHIPCYYVTRLDQAMQRMLRIELSGKYEEPQSTEIIRTGGNPSLATGSTGQCQLQSGATTTTVTAY